MNFVIDRITGTLYRPRELPFFEPHVLKERARHEPFVWIEPRDIEVNDGVGALVAALFADDEKFVSMDPAGDRLVDRFAVVTVRGGVPEGLPPRAPAELRRLVLEASKRAPERPAGVDSPAYRPPPRPSSERERPVEPRPISFLTSDLILGGVEHESALTSVIMKARHRIIIHSTFIAEDKFNALKPRLLDAVQRHGVEIDILWGQDDEKTATRSTKATVVRLRTEIATAGYSAKLRLHPFSTTSHAKLIVADDGRPDRHLAILGSCNWLYSGFQSFEVSVRLRDPRIVADVLDQLAELSRAPGGHWTDLTIDLAALGHDIRRRPPPSGSGAQAAIVLGPQHAHYVRQARDEARRRIAITSHRFGAAGRPIVVIPTIAAAKAKDIQVKVFWGTTSGDFKAEDVARVTAAAMPANVVIQQVHEPRLHAKILAWDDDFTVITSQNWLSADPSETNSRREIGVFLQSSAVARLVIDHLEAVRR